MFHCCNEIEVCIEQTTGEDADEQGGVHFLRNRARTIAMTGGRSDQIVFANISFHLIIKKLPKRKRVPTSYRGTGMPRNLFK